MSYAFETALYQRIRSELNKVPIIDCHEHLQRESELPTGDQAHIGRFFMHYASCDLVSAGMPLAEMTRVQDGTNGLSATERWAFLKPWYCKARNTAYFDALRIAFRDLYGVEDLADDTVEPLTATMRRQIRPGFTRAVFNKAGIDYAMNNPFTPKPIFNPDYGTDCFIVDMFDDFTTFPIARLAEDSGLDIKCLGDYLQVIDFYFARDGHCASAFKVSRAYDRPLIWDDVARSTVEGTFNRLLVANDCLDQQSIHALEDFIMHYLVRKCGEYDLRLKFHTGFQEGNGNTITNSRAGMLCNLFLQYPKTKFDIYHISYPYQEEATVITKNFPNVTINFCFNWVCNPAATRRALSDMLDCIPANKIHGFGGDYFFVEGVYGHAEMTRREITRVLCEKVEEGRFTEEDALRVGTMLLRDNAIENFDLTSRRAAFKARVDGMALA